MGGFEQGLVVLVALAVLLVVGEWRYRKARRERAARLGDDPLFQLEMKIEDQDKIVSALENQRARQGVFADEALIQELDRQHAELRRLKAQYRAASASHNAQPDEPAEQSKS